MLIDSEAIAFVSTLKKREREALYRRFEMIREDPDLHAEFLSRDASGRELDGCIEDRFAILFWDDFADRHVKIMDVIFADNVGRL